MKAVAHLLRTPSGYAVHPPCKPNRVPNIGLAQPLHWKPIPPNLALREQCNPGTDGRANSGPARITDLSPGNGRAPVGFYQALDKPSRDPGAWPGEFPWRTQPCGPRIQSSQDEQPAGRPALLAAPRIAWAGMGWAASLLARLELRRPRGIKKSRQNTCSVWVDPVPCYHAMCGRDTDRRVQDDAFGSGPTGASSLGSC